MANITEEWAKLAEGQLRRHRAGFKATLAQTDRQIRKLKVVLEDLEKLRARIDNRLAAYAEGMADLKLMREDPVVLIRTSGAGSYAYHSAEQPCGWVRTPEYYERVLWGEARVEGKRPCSSCGHYADQQANQARPRRETEAD